MTVALVIALAVAAKALLDPGSALMAASEAQEIEMADSAHAAPESADSGIRQAAVAAVVSQPPPVALPETASIPVAVTTTSESKVEPAASVPKVEPAASAPVADHSRVDSSRIMRRFNQFMLAEQLDDARELLESTRVELGDDHLLSARMQGYFCMKADCLPQSRTAYEAILARLPSDREAQYNLVLVSWQQGRQQEARHRVRELLVRHPNDADLLALINQLGEPQ